MPEWARASTDTGTGDEIDPAIGERVFKTRSSAELLGLGLIVEWAKAARLVRVVQGRLVPVKKAAALLDHPAELWMALPLKCSWPRPAG